jgi:thiol-disulfide isomerase/thioredoxin
MVHRIRQLVGLLATAIVVCSVLAACTGKNAVNSSGNGEFKFKSATALGKTIPVNDRKTVGDNVHGTLLDGTPWNLDADKGDVVVVNFWASWCAPCKIETPQFDSLYRQLKAQHAPVTFVGIDTKETSSSAGSTFVSENHISYPIVYDEPGATVAELGNLPASSLPFIVVIDKSQRVAAVYEQVLLPADLSPVLTSLAAES